MTTLKTALIWLGYGGAVLIAVITLAMTMGSKRGREMEREHDLDERMGEE